MVNYLCKKFSRTTYLLSKIRPLQTDKQTTDDNHAIARPLLKYGRLKTCRVASNDRFCAT